MPVYVCVFVFVYICMYVSVLISLPIIIWIKIGRNKKIQDSQRSLSLKGEWKLIY